MMAAGARTALTLLGLLLLLVVAAMWGWSAVTDPLPGKTESPVCVDRTFDAGDKLFPNQVTVTVLNAGETNGLAGSVLQQFRDDGFGTATAANAADRVEVSYAEIWTTDPESPAVALVASRLGPRAEVVERSSDEPGVVVVVGDQFGKLLDGRRSVVVKESATVCSPARG